MKTIYNAGSMFNEAQIQQRKKEGNNLRQNFADFEIANPIDFDTNLGVCPTPLEIWNADYELLKKAEYVIFELDSLDHGMIAEMGIAIEMAKSTQANKFLVTVISDFRYYQRCSKFQINEFSINHFVFGQLFDTQLNQENRILQVKSHDQAILAIKNWEAYLNTKDDKYLKMNEELDQKFIYEDGKMYDQ
ncbi:nucleoside 2-deoxyribosyltransferase [Spiroplasma endosymbiont of Panorpa germanica]|uniref:nucleoside 2-deoxyribosyltransferase n=1 Tax=Spiroplasma endosymbiont of Panorpa germanica TaxID=3066314 RepID=UPI0030D2158A